MPEVTYYLKSKVLDPLRALRSSAHQNPVRPTCDVASKRINVFQQVRVTAKNNLVSEFGRGPLRSATTVHVFIDTKTLGHPNYFYAKHTLRLHEERAKLSHSTDRQTVLHYVRMGPGALFPTMHCSWARVAVLEIVAQLSNANLILF